MRESESKDRRVAAPKNILYNPRTPSDAYLSEDKSVFKLAIMVD